MKTAMLSRVADSLFWMGRYLERAEQMARQLDVARDILVDLSEPDPAGASAERQATSASLCIPNLPFDRLVFDAAQPCSLSACVSQARENARQVREVITREMWERINQAHWSLVETHRQAPDDTALTQTFADILVTSAIWDGLTDASMYRSEAWAFLKLGKWMERMDRNARCILARLHQLSLTRSSTQMNVISIVMLKSVGALEAYRKVSPTKVDQRAVLSFLLFQPNYPRSLRYCATQSSVLTGQLCPVGNGFAEKVVRTFGRLSSQLENGDIDEVLANGPEGFLNEVLRGTNHAGTLLHSSYFLQ